MPSRYTLRVYIDLLRVLLTFRYVVIAGGVTLHLPLRSVTRCSLFPLLLFERVVNLQRVVVPRFPLPMYRLLTPRLPFPLPLFEHVGATGLVDVVDPTHLRYIVRCLMGRYLILPRRPLPTLVIVCLLSI